jgi:hypothetical protein
MADRIGEPGTAGGGAGDLVSGHMRQVRPPGTHLRTGVRPPSFLQVFPNFRLFAPNISKESFGGFVGYQRVAIDPNQIVRFQIFLPSRNPKKLPDPWTRFGDLQKQMCHKFRFLESEKCAGKLRAGGSILKAARRKLPGNPGSVSV